MGFLSRETSVQALNKLLDQERKAILEGDYGRLEKLLAKKERLLQAAADTPGNRADLMALDAKAKRNAQLLTAAARGVKAAQHRLSALKSGAAALNTYGPGGSLTSLSRTDSAMTRKA